MGVGGVLWGGGWYLQHEHHGLDGVPLGLPSVNDDGEAAGLALLAVWRVVKDLTWLSHPEANVLL